MGRGKEAYRFPTIYGRLTLGNNDHPVEVGIAHYWAVNRSLRFAQSGWLDVCFICVCTTSTAIGLYLFGKEVEKGADLHLNQRSRT